MKKSILLLLLFSFILPLIARAEEEPKFKAAPAACVLVDGALYASPEKYLFRDGLAIPEARIGAKMWYGKWSVLVDVGIAYGKIGLRNMWMQYEFNKNHFARIGNFLQPFGYQSPFSANVKCTFEQPIASAPFTPGIQLGGMYVFHNPMFYSATAFHAESSALTNIMNYPLFNQQGFTFLERFVVRNKRAAEKDSPVLQAGISLGYSTPDRHLIDDYDVHQGFSNNANFPTRVSVVEAVGVVIGEARNRFKLTPELVLSCKRLALESQYYFQTIARKDGLKAYNAQSAYVTLRGVIFGKNYGYDEAQAILSNPNKNTLECVLNYNYTTLSDSKAGIYGGRANSCGITFNYYFNPYITARLNYTYTYAWDKADVIPLTQNAFQLRLMVQF